MNRGVILLLGLIAFIATCFTFSPDSASIPQICGFGIYFLFGLLLFRSRKDRIGSIIFFAPFCVWIYVVLTNNPGLFPDVVPLLIVTCLAGFYTGAFSVTAFHARKLIALAMLAVFGGLYLLIVVQLIVPKIVFNRLSESLPETEIWKEEWTFINQLQDSVAIPSNSISVVDFWFTKCGVCYPNNDYLNAQATKYKSLGVKFYLVYMGEIDSFKEFQEVHNKFKWRNLIHLYDSANNISKKLKLEGAPHTFVISDGKIIYHQAGFSEEAKLLENRKLNDLIMSEVARNADSKSIYPGKKNVIDLGEINSNLDSLFTYRMHNTLNKPLYIKDVTGSCNCLITDWSKEPIPSNEYGSISFKFVPDTTSEQGKTIMISTSSNETPYTVVDISYRLKTRR